jgi:hypothetical protein
MTREEVLAVLVGAAAQLTDAETDPTTRALYASRLMAAADTVSALYEAQAWRPIGLAPRDGTWFVAHDSATERTDVLNWPEGRKLGRWDYLRRPGSVEVEGRWAGAGASFDATHWMPLPPIPEGQ